jgi:hypothetical protein
MWSAPALQKKARALTRAQMLTSNQYLCRVEIVNARDRYFSRLRSRDTSANNALSRASSRRSGQSVPTERSGRSERIQEGLDYPRPEVIGVRHLGQPRSANYLRRSDGV